MPEQFSHCSYCGAPFQLDQPYPRQCAACGNLTFRNPLPVVVTLVPCEQGVLLVRRGIPPRLGELALPGGFINYGESWQQAAAREVAEETGLHLAPEVIQVFAVRSAPDSTLIIVGIAPPQPDPPPGFTSPEVSEVAFTHQPIPLAFPLHTESLQRYFSDLKGNPEMSPISLEEIPEKEIVPGFHARFVHSEHMTLAYWRIEAGSALPEHSHPHEQVLNLLEGEFEAVVAGETSHLRAGMVSIIPGGVPHSGKALTACRILDAFYPVRQEYR